MLICQVRRMGHRCGAINHDDARFCAQCGGSLHAALLVRDPGTSIGPYRIVGVIGHGGYGAVYEAEVIARPNVHVALKETLDPEHAHSFRSEFGVLSGLRHDNLPRYHEVFEREERGFLVMELIRGQSLRDIMRKEGGAVSERLALAYIYQVCDVLSYLHSQSSPIIHRDIKPDNVRLTPEALIKLVDFGLAKAGLETTEHNRGGTPAYAPLEQWLGGTDARSDIYSLGATLYHLLTGKVPPAAAARHTALGDLLVSPQQHNPRVSTMVAEVVMRAMALRPIDRYADIEQFHDDLHEAERRSRSTRPLARAGGTTPLYNMVPERLTASYMREVGQPPAPVLTQASGATPHGIWQSATDEPSGLAWSPNGATLALAMSDGRIVLLEVGEGQRPRVERTLSGHMGSALAVAWSVDGQTLASSGRDQQVRLWAAERGQALMSWPWSGGTVLSLAWDPSGALLACGSWDGQVQLLKPTEESPSAAFRDHGQGVNALAWEPRSGRRLVSAGADGALAARRAADGALLFKSAPTHQPINSVTWSPDGRLLACAKGDGQIQFIYANDGTQALTIRPHTRAANAVAWSPDGQLIASASATGTICLWRPLEGERLARLEGHSGPALALAWSPDGRLLASASADRSVRIWEMR
jgi:WD40 repeat protein